MTSQRPLNVLAVLRGSPRNRNLKRAIASYRRACKREGIRNPDQPSEASVECTADGGTYVILDLDGYQRIYALLPGNRLKAVRHYPAAIDAYYAESNAARAAMPATRSPGSSGRLPGP
jgi:hypothetical protein